MSTEPIAIALTNDLIVDDDQIRKLRAQLVELPLHIDPAVRAGIQQKLDAQIAARRAVVLPNIFALIAKHGESCDRHLQAALGGQTALSELFGLLVSQFTDRIVGGHILLTKPAARLQLGEVCFFWKDEINVDRIREWNRVRKLARKRASDAGVARDEAAK